MSLGRSMVFLALLWFVASPSTSLSQTPGKLVRADRLGDALPEGALKRFGTTRLRHLKSVRQVAFTPDGKHLASVGDDNVFSLWELATGKERKHISWADTDATTDSLAMAERVAQLQLQFFGRPDTDASRNPRAVLSPDGKFLALARDDKLRVIDTETGKQTGETAIKTGKTGLLELAAGGKLLARYATVNEQETELTVIDFPTGKQLHKLRLSNRYLLGMLLSPDGKYLAGRDQSNQIALWELTTGKRIRAFDGNDGTGGGAMAFVPGTDKFASGGMDGVWFWDHSSDEPVAKFPIAPGGAAFTIAVSLNGKTLATTGQDSSITLWDVAAGNQIRKLAGHTFHIATIAFSPDGKSLASGSYDGEIRIWDLVTGRESTPLEHLARVQPIAYLKSGAILVQAEDSTTLKHLDGNTGEVQCTFPGPTEMYAGLAVAPSGKLLALLDPETTNIKLWDVAGNKETHQLEGHGGRANRMVFSADSAYLASVCTQDRTLRVWHTAVGKEVRRFELPFGQEEQRVQVFFRVRGGMHQGNMEMPFQEFAFTPDNRALIGLAPDGVAYIWEMATGKERAKLPVGPRLASQLTISPDSRLFAAITHDDTVRVWDVFRGKAVQGFVSREGEVRTLTFGPDSRLLAAGFANGTIAIYDLVNGTQKRRYVGHKGPVQKLLFADSGHRLLSAARDGTMLVWDVNAPPSVSEADKGPDDAHLTALWNRLAHADAAEAYEAIGILAEHPAASVKLLHAKLQPVAAVDEARVQQLLADLDNAGFAARDKAAYELTKLGDQIVPTLRKAQGDKLSAERTRRIGQILEKLAERRNSPESLRLLRAVEVLERIAGPEAIPLLESLAAGAREALLTAAAKDALQRLQTIP